MYMVIRNLAKRYGDKVVLQDISLQVEKGRLVALLGPSGCGKTTLLNAIAGLADIDGGSIHVDGQLYSGTGRTLPPERRKIGMVFQDFALWPHMNVYDNIAFGLKVQKQTRSAIEKRVRHVLEAVRMGGYEKRYPHQLSGGQKQRVAIARALAPEPAVLLMDEPLSSLDAKLREEMRWELLGIVQHEKTTTIYVTHDQVEALSMADHVVVMNQGRIEQQGPPAALYQRPHTVFTASFLGVSNLYTGRIRSRDPLRQTVTVDCGGFCLEARDDGTARGDRTTVAVRPADIELRAQGGGSEEEAGLSLNVLRATVVQRAFHGITWQYRVLLDATLDVLCEVWHAQALPIGARVCLHFPMSACLTVNDSPGEAVRL
jgi:ABC-type Fe3+/spermidine/putrescine transport system ATPase subunit